METDERIEFLNTEAIRITPEILSLIAEIDEFKVTGERSARSRLSGCPA